MKTKKDVQADFEAMDMLKDEALEMDDDSTRDIAILHLFPFIL